MQVGGARSDGDVVLGVHANNLLSSERDCMVYVRRLKERQNVIKMFRVTHPHGFLVLEAPEPKCGCSQVVAEKYILLFAIIVSSIGDVRVLPWQVACHIRAKNISVTCKIMTEGVSPQFVELFPRVMTAGVGPVGVSANQ
jgi:hypothetical protein